LFGGIGGVEILIILVIGIVVFGVIKMPRIARILGSGMNGYKRLKKGFTVEDIVKKFQGNDEEKQDRKTTPGNHYEQGPQQPPHTTDQYGFGPGPWQPGWHNSGQQNYGFGNQGSGWQQPPQQQPPGQQWYPPQQPPDQSYPPDTGPQEKDPPENQKG
jgi:Sec-independent protein translocase protein TatA